jgi:hypothetical protein
MKKLVFASILATSAFSVCALADDITGYISDAHCAAKHNSVSAANTKCIDMCLKGGADPVLVSNGKVMKFDADSKEKAKSFAGQEVKIDGTVDGDVVKVNSIDKAQ